MALQISSGIAISRKPGTLEFRRLCEIRACPTTGLLSVILLDMDISRTTRRRTRRDVAG